jgi:hypothetical protein
VLQAPPWADQQFESARWQEQARQLQKKWVNP